MCLIIIGLLYVCLYIHTRTQFILVNILVLFSATYLIVNGDYFISCHTCQRSGVSVPPPLAAINQE